MPELYGSRAVQGQLKVVSSDVVPEQTRQGQRNFSLC